jgi:exodeoxyribonuclease III
VRIATYNVNSIRARAERILAWTRAERPDVLCMQELKAEDKDFPLAAFAELGYHAAVWGQKTYNGVALLSLSPLEDVRRGFDGPASEQARLVSAMTRGIRVHCVYAPNGEAPGTEKFAYKLGWMERFAALVARDVAAGEPVAVGGDFNVAPTDVDVYDPDGLRETIHVSTPEREALARIVEVGLIDAFRRAHPKERAYTFWDYRMLAFPKNRGYRIDHVLLTPDLAERLVGAKIDREARKGEKPSDHAPLIIELKGSE